MTKERIESIKEILLPFIAKKLKEINYEGLGESDAKEFTQDFNEILNLAFKALEQETTNKKDLGVDVVSRKELLKIYEDRFLELQKLKHLKDNKGAEDRQMGVNYCINILKELPSVTPQETKWIPVSEMLPECEQKV